MANNNKIEKDAVYTVGLYLNKCPKLDHIINMNDKTPIYDGNIYAYNDVNHKIDNYFATVPLQVKGTTSTKNYYRIAREYIEGYKKDKGCIFFLVQEKIRPIKVLYAILTPAVLDQLLQQKTKTIRIDLNEVPTDPKKFETEIFVFANKRNEEKTEISSPKEIADLVKGFEKIREFLGEIEDNEAKYELESLLDSIKNTKDDGTIGWRDKFIYYSRKALDLASNNLKDHDLAAIHHNFGKYLYDQKQYHLVEYYYLKALEEYRKREDNVNIANTLNNLGELHRVVTRYEDAEVELQEALDLRCRLAKAIRNPYVNNLADTFKNLADTSNNLAVLHATLNKHEKAEKEWKDALEIYRVLIMMNRLAYIENVAMTLNNLAILHNKLNCNAKAEEEYQEALELYRELANTNYDVYIADVAMTLNNLAILHMTLTCNEKAEQEYQEALKIRRELAKTNREAHIGDVAMILNNLAIVHKNLSRYEEAELEYKEALEIRRGLARTNRDAYIEQVANTLLNLALLLYIDETRLDEARNAANEALGIYKELAKKYPQIWSKDVEDTQELLEIINQTS